MGGHRHRKLCRPYPTSDIWRFNLISEKIMSVSNIRFESVFFQVCPCSCYVHVHVLVRVDVHVYVNITLYFHVAWTKWKWTWKWTQTWTRTCHRYGHSKIQMSDFGYRKKKISPIFDICQTPPSDNRGGQIRLSLLLFITDIGLSVHLYQGL